MLSGILVALTPLLSSLSQSDFNLQEILLICCFRHKNHNLCSLSLSLKFMIHFWSFLLPSANIFLYFFSPCYLLLIYFSFFSP
ncbi:Os01g0923950 [Oryza sativa Japonica Group]|uniref:Os01g0923950 protein n=1 Tax=Oryza sativa subsp. japonica TaxID=39947 RepID=A0A0P0VC67_ORYSJ|nr:Os01g0923950 [Oryza sativa Japonica Group]